MPADVQWRNPAGEVVNASADGRFSVDENNELTIDPVHERDEGKWTCEASNQMGADELTYTVDAKYGRLEGFAQIRHTKDIVSYKAATRNVNALDS